MARLADLQGHKVGLDTVVFIYALEGHPNFGDRATQLFEQIEQGAMKAAACDLVLAELMVKPLRSRQPEIAEEYARDLPQFPNLNFCEMTLSVTSKCNRLQLKSWQRILLSSQVMSSICLGKRKDTLLPKWTCGLLYSYKNVA